MQDLARMICLIWAGLSIGGVWIATPAKFAAPSLSLATALDVGRAQFFWLSVGQLLICALLLLCLAWTKRFAWRVTVGALAVFLAQVAVLAFLDRTTLDVMSGGGSDGVLHMLFMVLEAAKLACLVVAGFIPEWRQDAPARHRSEVQGKV